MQTASTLYSGVIEFRRNHARSPFISLDLQIGPPLTGYGHVSKRTLYKLNYCVAGTLHNVDDRI